MYEFGRLRYKRVEIFSRADKIGLWRLLDDTLKNARYTIFPWIDMSFYGYISDVSIDKTIIKLNDCIYA